MQVGYYHQWCGHSTPFSVSIDSWVYVWKGKEKTKRGYYSSTVTLFHLHRERKDPSFHFPKKDHLPNSLLRNTWLF